MSTFDELNKELKEYGFEIDGDDYVFDKLSYQTTIINGRKFQNPQHSLFKMKYIGDGCELNDSDEPIEDTEMYGFDILDGEDSVATIFIRNLNDLKSFIDV